VSTARGPSPVFQFQKNPSMIDYPGHLAAVFFTSGCNFRCGFCHNAALIEPAGAAMSWERVTEACDAFRGNWADAAVITGGEPTMAGEGLAALIDLFKERGLLVKLDTNGSAPEVLARVLPRVDYVAMDVKTDRDGYPDLTGCADIHMIEESIRLIREGDTEYEFRTTVIPGVHDAGVMRGIGELVKGAKRHVLQPFVPRDDLPDPRFRAILRPAEDLLGALADELRPFVTDVSIR
jgi:pyruvate formate lyase activating enzyme